MARRQDLDKVRLSTARLRELRSACSSSGVAVGATALQAGLIKASTSTQLSVSWTTTDEDGEFAAILVTATETGGGSCCCWVADAGSDVRPDRRDDRAWAVNVAGGPFWSQRSTPFLVGSGATALLFTGAAPTRWTRRRSAGALAGVIRSGSSSSRLPQRTTWVLLNGKTQLFPTATIPFPRAPGALEPTGR